MRKSLYGALLGLALAGVFALAQSTNPPSSQMPSATQDQDRNAAQQPASQTPSNAQEDKGERKQKAKGEKKHESKGETAENEGLERQIQQQLATDAALSNIRAEVHGKEIVILTGTAPSKKDRDHAKQLAESVPGVRKVKDKIKIGGAAASASAMTAAGTAGTSAASSQSATTTNPAGAAMGGGAQSQGVGASGSVGSGSTNSTVQAQIQQGLQNEPTLSPSVVQNIAVNVVNDHVILSGTVPTERDKDKAQQVAQRQASGMQVVNNIQVSSSGLVSRAAGAGTGGGVAGAAGSMAPSTPAQGASGSSGEC